jgi:hypothetical protein
MNNAENEHGAERTQDFVSINQRFKSRITTVNQYLDCLAPLCRETITLHHIQTELTNVPPENAARIDEQLSTIESLVQHHTDLPSLLAEVNDEIAVLNNDISQKRCQLETVSERRSAMGRSEAYNLEKRQQAECKPVTGQYNQLRGQEALIQCDLSKIDQKIEKAQEKFATLKTSLINFQKELSTLNQLLLSPMLFAELEDKPHDAKQPKKKRTRRQRPDLNAKQTQGNHRILSAETNNQEKSTGWRTAAISFACIAAIAAVLTLMKRSDNNNTDINQGSAVKSPLMDREKILEKFAELRKNVDEFAELYEEFKKYAERAKGYAYLQQIQEWSKGSHAEIPEASEEELDHIEAALELLGDIDYPEFSIAEWPELLQRTRAIRKKESPNPDDAVFKNFDSEGKAAKLMTRIAVLTQIERSPFVQTGETRDESLRTILMLRARQLLQDFDEEKLTLHAETPVKIYVRDKMTLEKMQDIGFTVASIDDPLMKEVGKNQSKRSTALSPDSNTVLMWYENRTIYSIAFGNNREPLHADVYIEKPGVKPLHVPIDVGDMKNTLIIAIDTK